ncbi:MAG: hypothetical protein V1664_05025 [Candidatus Uhrbacteria bacterium]
MTLKILTQKISLLEKKIAQLECRINVSNSSLPNRQGRKWMIKYPLFVDSKIKRLNAVITKSAGILKKNKKLPKNPVVWQKQIRQEWN